jgi:hypothetical protein
MAEMLPLTVRLAITVILTARIKIDLNRISKAILPPLSPIRLLFIYLQLIYNPKNLRELLYGLYGRRKVVPPLQRLCMAYLQKFSSLLKFNTDAINKEGPVCCSLVKDTSLPTDIL